jgi:hypothetical protein
MSVHSLLYFALALAVAHQAFDPLSLLHVMFLLNFFDELLRRVPTR